MFFPPSDCDERLYNFYINKSNQQEYVPGTSADSTDEVLDFLLGELTAVVNGTLLLLLLLPLPPVDTASSGSWDVHPESSASSVMSLQSPYPYSTE